MKHAPLFRFIFIIFTGLVLLTCVSEPPHSELASIDAAPVHPINLADYDVTGEPRGHYDLSGETVFGFSQTGNLQEDPQVYSLQPDVNMRAWQKWGKDGLSKNQYTRDYITHCLDKKILFIGGGTMSVLFAEEAANQSQFLDWATRDAKGELVEHAYIAPGAHRGSLANPAYREYLINYLKEQIDLGVTGLFLDELNAGYSGGNKWLWNGNEGYDDYFIGDFNRYLLHKYPRYTSKDWCTRFKMSSRNLIRRDIPYNDLVNNFNYRKYLQEKGWATNPRTASNPLAAEWGYIISNRFDVHDTSFTGKYLGLYFKDIVSRLRAYARDKYNREILITANGIYPWMDYNSLGLYEFNPDEPGSSADYVPVFLGHLNGRKSLKSTYLKMLLKSQDVSGPVPLVMFMDWPTAMINGYYKLPLAEKMDFWQIYAAEAYACGLRFAFHLKTVMPGEPTATESGILPFLTTYATFYKEHGDLYKNTINSTLPVSISRPQVTWNLTQQVEQGRYLLHLINHNYDQRIIPQENLTASLPLKQNPVRVTLISPDEPGGKLPYTFEKGTLSVDISHLKYYDVLVIE